MTHPFLKAVHAIKSNPGTKLFHGSPVSGITEFDLSKKRTEDVFLTEGRGVYLTSHFDTAKSYGPYVYEVKIKGPIFDATKFESLKKILVLVKQETDVDLTKHKEILKALEAMVEGRYSILAENGLVWQIKLILDSDEDFAQRADDIEAVSNVVERAVNEVKAMKYFDPKISKSPLYIVRDPKCVEIVREIKTNPKSKVGSSEIFTSDDGSKSFHLNKDKGVWLVSWEPHTFNVRKFAKKTEAMAFIKSKLKEKSNPESDLSDYDDIIEDLMNLYHQGDTIHNIARRLRMSPPIVKKLLASQGVDVEAKQLADKLAAQQERRKVKSNPEEEEGDEEIMQLYQGGKTIAQVAKRVGISEKKVSLALKRMGIPLRMASPRNDEIKVDDIVVKLKSGATIEDIAKSYNTTTKTIYSRLKEAGLSMRVRRKQKNLEEFMKDVKDSK